MTHLITMVLAVLTHTKTVYQIVNYHGYFQDLFGLPLCFCRLNKETCTSKTPLQISLSFLYIIIYIILFQSGLVHVHVTGTCRQHSPSAMPSTYVCSQHCTLYFFVTILDMHTNYAKIHWLLNFHCITI